MKFIDKIKEQARSDKRLIILPEPEDQRTLRAANEVISTGIADLILIGDPQKIEFLANDWGLSYIDKARIVDPKNNPKREEYINLMLEIRREKGLTREDAEKLVEQPLHLSAVMVRAGDADGAVAGAQNLTSDVLRPAFQYVGTKPGISIVSGAFVMSVEDMCYGDNGIMIFADCAVNPNPDAQQLAEIAICSAHTAQTVAGIEPKVAMLSFSTKGSGKHESVDKVRKATEIAKKLAPDLIIDGEMQADAAIVPGIASSKAPGSPVKGRANVLVFPTLDVGNITYKLVQRLGNADAVGPILQGMLSPINDLSRGCSQSDIVSLIAITVCQAQQK